MDFKKSRRIKGSAPLMPKLGLAATGFVVWAILSIVKSLKQIAENQKKQ